MTREDAARVLGVTTRTVKRWIDTGRLEAVKKEGDHGPEWNISEESVQRASETFAVARMVQEHPPQTQHAAALLAEAMKASFAEAMDKMDERHAERDAQLAAALEKVTEELSALREEVAASKERPRRWWPPWSK